MIEKEDDQAAARREASEELGVALHGLERVARVWSSPGVSTERQSLFLATYGAGKYSGDTVSLWIGSNPADQPRPCIHTEVPRPD